MEIGFSCFCIFILVNYNNLKHLSYMTPATSINDGLNSIVIEYYLIKADQEKQIYSESN